MRAFFLSLFSHSTKVTHASNTPSLPAIVGFLINNLKSQLLDFGLFKTKHAYKRKDNSSYQLVNFLPRTHNAACDNIVWGHEPLA